MSKEREKKVMEDTVERHWAELLFISSQAVIKHPACI